MGVSTKEFESFEQQFLELIVDFQTIASSESRLRDALREESTRAEAAEAARDAAACAAAEARSGAAAAAAGATLTTSILVKLQDELATTKMQFELAERHRVALEEKCGDMSTQLDSLTRELQKLRPLQASLTNLQRRYTELQERIQCASRDARRETSRLETELRRVEKCASGGGEVRDRARLAAAAHVRERRLAGAELQHTTHELHHAKAELTRLGALVAELQCRLSLYSKKQSTTMQHALDPSLEALAEARAALEAERNGTARLERALAAALADNATLALHQHTSDNAASTPAQAISPLASASTTTCPIDSFLAE